MATRLSVGGGGGENVAAFNIAAGEATSLSSGAGGTNLSAGAGGVSAGSTGGVSNSILSQVENFADEMVLGELEKREFMGRRINRRMSLAMVGCFCLFFVILTGIVGRAVFGKTDDEFKGAKISDSEGQLRYERLMSLLEPITGASLTDEGTAEQKALHWLAYDDPADLDPTTTHLDKLTQRFVLATLWEATRGSSWRKQYSFRSRYDECEWNNGEETELGAYCNDDGFVERLILENNRLDGDLVRDIGLLTHLVHIDLKGNQLKSNMPSSIGLLHKLTHLDFSANELSGIAPENAQKMNKLHRLYLQNNKLEGEIPYEYLVDLAEIQEVDLSNNRFSGIVHDHLQELWGMSNLKSLNLASNKFEGTIPPFFRRISSLESLDFSSNSFTGVIPGVYGRMKSLKSFDVSQNELTGEIPTDFGDDSEFSGDAKTLEVFRASNNSLVGSVPTQLGNIKKLGILMLDSNGLSGSIPTELGQLTGLEILYLDNNDFNGPIPTELSKCRALTQLKLSNNRLEGRIPTEIGQLGNVARMDLRQNFLQGQIPTELNNMPELVALYISGNALAGNLDDILCDRPSLYPPWQTLVSDCLEQLVICSCCTSCCDNNDFCCTPGSKACNTA